MAQDQNSTRESCINRRDFVATAAVVAAVAGVGCLCDCAHAQATTQPSAAGATTLDVGLKTDFAKDGVVTTWVKSDHVIVSRENGKLFAMTSKCTHRGCDLSDDGTGLNCGCHNSEFAYDGTVTQAPARRALPRFAISVNADGHVMVDTSQKFAQAKWSDPASFVLLNPPT